tara:strand:- start:130 stop:378 length:249 start_codon:yes stop_codon:yes gene_type:complete
MDTDKFAWQHIKALLSRYEDETGESREQKADYLLKSLMFGVAFIAENEELPAAKITTLQSQVRNEVRILTDRAPIGYQVAEA